MKHCIAISFVLFFLFETGAQNVGIGTTAPGFPLNFSNALGDKISLYGNSGAHYGFGIQSGLLQIHSDAAAANIAFGYGSSTGFTERMRIINTGENGLLLNGRMTMRNGTSPVDVNQTPGIWLYKPDNTALLGFVGAQNNQNIGFYGGPAGWGFTYNAINSRVGIGNNDPANRLDVAGLNNWDLVNTEGDMRIGNNNYRIKMGIALDGGGAGSAGIMQSGGIGALHMGANNKNLLQLNGTGNFIDFTNVSGGLRINGSAGNTGEVLTTNGQGSAPVWSPGTNFIYNNSYKKSSLSFSNVGGAGNPSLVVVPDLAQLISVSRKVMALVSWNYTAYSNPCAFCGNSSLFTSIRFNGNLVHQLDEDIANGTRKTQTGSVIVFLDPGNYNVEVTAMNFSNGISVSVGGNNTGVTASLNIVLYPL